MSQATMKKAPAVQLEAPRFENAEPLRIAGLREHFTPETMKTSQSYGGALVLISATSPDKWATRLMACVSMRSAPMVSIISWVSRSPTLQIVQAISASPTSRHRNMLFFHTVNMFRRCIKLWMQSTSGSRDPASRSPVKPLRRRIFSSATPRNLIRGLEWAVWKFGFQSRLEACQQVLLQFHSGESVYKVYREN